MRDRIGSPLLTGGNEALTTRGWASKRQERVIMEDELLEVWYMGYQQGKADARNQCDVCPARLADGLPVLVHGADVIRRPAIEN